MWDQVCDMIASRDSTEQLNLEHFERLLCAAFQSKHRHVVNSVAMLWNRVFHDAEEIAYPEALQATLMSVRSLVDLVLPGLDESSGESAAAQHSHAFVQSQDDMIALKVSPIKSARSDRVHFVSSGSSVVPTPSKTLQEDPTPKTTTGRPKRQRRSRAKLRHEDSQIQFEPVQTVAPEEDESQNLTEHQLEVREQQRGQEALYNMKSSSPPRDHHEVEMADAAEISSPVLPDAKKETPKKHTPGVQKSYEDYISSTPTPRRGQMLSLHQDVEMSDPPSSPPELSEVRRYPLVPEMRSRSNSVTDNVHWEFSSSPVSGSPLPMQRVIVQQQEPEEEEAELEAAEEVAEQGETSGGEEAENDKPQQEPESSQDIAVVEDSFAMDVVPSSAAHENVAALEASKPEVDESIITTPSRRRTRQSVREDSLLQQAQQQQERRPTRSAPTTPTRARGRDVTPKSDNEEFVDAPSSPQATTAQKSRKPAATSQALPSSQGDDTSYAISEGAERSMIRLAEEAEAKQAALKRVTRRSKKAGTVDCIMVKTDEGEEDGEEELSSGQEDTSQMIPSTPLHQTSPAEGKSSKSSVPKRKRKRGSSSRYVDPRTKKRRSGGDDGCSVTSSPSFRLQSSQGGSDLEDDDVQSQVLSEHIAASQSQSRQSPELGDDTTFNRPEAGAEAASETRSDKRGGSSQSKPASYKIEKHFKKALEKMRSVSLSRDEMYRIEDMFLDFKRELYEAERRGREDRSPC